MSNLVVFASPQGEASTSRKVANSLITKLGLCGVVKDLAETPPTFVDGNWVSARFNPQATEEHKNAPSTLNSDAAVAEFLAAQTIVVATPMHNFTVPAALKAWFDQIAVVGKSFKYGANGPEGLASGKKVYVVVSAGGVGMGTPADFLSPYVRTFFGFLGIADVSFFWVTKGDDKPALAQIEAL